MGISIPQLLIILLIVALLFGTKKLRGIGSDLGSALKGFKNAMKEDDKDAEDSPDENTPGNVIEGDVHQAEQASEQKEEKV